LGIELLRLRPLARRLAIAFFAFSAINTLLFIVLPGYHDRVEASMVILPAELRQQASVEHSDPLGLFPMIAGGLVNAFPIWFLVRRRSAFEQK
jgi:hypothetical protein